MNALARAPESAPVTQIALGRFHHFHLARQLEARGLLKEIWTGYPRFKLKDETGVPAASIKTFPWFYVPSVTVGRVPGIGRSVALRRALQWTAAEAIDAQVAKRIREPGVLVAMSSGGLKSGRRMRACGGRYVCDRGSTHIRFQDEILRDEYRLWNLQFPGVDPRIVDKEEAEYDAADRITVPSRFCKETFRSKGVPEGKIRVIPYGGRLDRFAPVGAPDPSRFTVLFVGGVSIRKGVPYLLQAFARLRHPRKRLKIVGYIDDDIVPVLRKLPGEHVEFLGPAANQELAKLYSQADALVLPSLEEGLSLVMAEAMACGCPVVASVNTGALDLFEPGQGGFITPLRSGDAILDALEALAQDPSLAQRMRRAARGRIESLGGYDRYGEQWAALLKEFKMTDLARSARDPRHRKEETHRA
jgi:glycosyltransferase involved in cell wall biosynthesis